MVSLFGKSHFGGHAGNFPARFHAIMQSAVTPSRQSTPPPSRRSHQSHTSITVPAWRSARHTVRVRHDTGLWLLSGNQAPPRLGWRVDASDDSASTDVTGRRQKGLQNDESNTYHSTWNRVQTNMGLCTRSFKQNQAEMSEVWWARRLGGGVD